MGYKNIKLKKDKNWVFPSFYFRQNTPGKCVLEYSGKKKSFSRL